MYPQLTAVEMNENALDPVGTQMQDASTDPAIHDNATSSLTPKAQSNSQYEVRASSGSQFNTLTLACDTGVSLVEEDVLSSKMVYAASSVNGHSTQSQGDPEQARYLEDISKRHVRIQ